MKRVRSVKAAAPGADAAVMAVGAVEVAGAVTAAEGAAVAGGDAGAGWGGGGGGGRWRWPGRSRRRRWRRWPWRTRRRLRWWRRRRPRSLIRVDRFSFSYDGRAHLARPFVFSQCEISVKRLPANLGDRLTFLRQSPAYRRFHFCDLTALVLIAHQRRAAHSLRHQRAHIQLRFRLRQIFRGSIQRRVLRQKH